MAFTHLSSILELQGFTFPVFEKTVGDNTLVVEQLNGETQRAIRVREFIPIAYNFEMPKELYGIERFEHRSNIVRKGLVIKDFTLHVDR